MIVILHLFFIVLPVACNHIYFIFKIIQSIGFFISTISRGFFYFVKMYSQISLRRMIFQKNSSKPVLSSGAFLLFFLTKCNILFIEFRDINFVLFFLYIRRHLFFKYLPTLSSINVPTYFSLSKPRAL